jgi:hypothetical protein
MLLQHLLEIAPRMGGGMFRYLLRSTRDDDLAALVAAFWTEIDDPIGAANHVEVVLNHQHRIALIDQSLNDVHHVMHPLQSGAVSRDQRTYKTSKARIQARLPKISPEYPNIGGVG